MTLPEALARVERLAHWYREAAALTERQEEMSAALTILLAEAHRAHRLREALPTLEDIGGDALRLEGACLACDSSHRSVHRDDCWIARLTAVLETP